MLYFVFFESKKIIQTISQSKMYLTQSCFLQQKKKQKYGKTQPKNLWVCEKIEFNCCSQTFCQPTFEVCPQLACIMTAFWAVMVFDAFLLYRRFVEIFYFYTPPCFFLFLATKPLIKLFFVSAMGLFHVEPPICCVCFVCCFY